MLNNRPEISAQVDRDSDRQTGLTDSRQTHRQSDKERIREKERFSISVKRENKRKRNCISSIKRRRNNTNQCYAVIRLYVLLEFRNC